MLDNVSKKDIFNGQQTKTLPHRENKALVNVKKFLSFHAAFNLPRKIPSIVNVLSIDLGRYAYFKLSIMSLYQLSPCLKIDPHN